MGIMWKEQFHKNLKNQVLARSAAAQFEVTRIFEEKIYITS